MIDTPRFVASDYLKYCFFFSFKLVYLNFLFEKQIVNSKYSYLATMVEIAREVHTEYTADDEDEFSALKYSLITSQDIK